MFLDALGDRLGQADARRVFADLREANDPEAPVSVPGSFPQELPLGRPRREASSSTTAASRARRSRRQRSPRTRCSSAPKRSATGHPLFVAGPRSATSSRSSSRRWSSRAPASPTRGAVFPGVPFVLIGRGPDFAWSATSSQADNRDLFVETLCADDRHYLYRGAVRADEPVLRRDAEGAGPARPAGLVLRDVARPGRSGTRPSQASASRSRSSARRAAASSSRRRRSTTLDTGQRQRRRSSSCRR